MMKSATKENKAGWEGERDSGSGCSFQQCPLRTPLGGEMICAKVLRQEHV